MVCLLVFLIVTVFFTNSLALVEWDIQKTLKIEASPLAADNQGKFWELHDRLFIDYNKLGDQKIREIALDLGFNTAEFETQMRDQKVLAKIRQDILDGKRAGVKGVPAVFINGRRLKNWSLKEFQILIDKELNKIKKNP